MEQEAIYVGIDVAKAQLDVAVRPTDDRWEVSHDDAGVWQMVSRLKAIEPAMVLLEASGGLDCRWWLPWQPTRCRWSSSTPAKCGTSPGPPGSWPRPTLWTQRSWLTSPKQSARPCAPLRDTETQALNSLAARRHQVMTMLVSEKNRLSSATIAVRPPHRGSHCMARAGAGRSGRGPASDSPSESRMAREGRPPAHRPRRGRAALSHPLGLPA